MRKISILIVNEITKRIEGRQGLNKISFKVASGEIVALTGPSDSGKTTLLQMITGKITPTSGTIEVKGKKVFPGRQDILSDIGVFSRDQGIYGRLTTVQYLSFFCKLYGLEKERIEEVISLVGLLDRKNENLKNFNDGFLARVQLARAILHQPDLLLLERPTVGIDLDSTEILRKLILQLAREGKAILITTYSLEEAKVLANRLGRLNQGSISSWEEIDDLNREGEEIARLGNHYKIEKIPAQVRDKIILFDPQELIYIESHEGKSLLHSNGQEYICPLTLLELEERLTPFGFFRSHRSYIVNLQRVKEVIPWTRNSYSLVLDDQNETTIPLSKNNFRELEQIFGL